MYCLWCLVLGFVCVLCGVDGCDDLCVFEYWYVVDYGLVCGVYDGDCCGIVVVDLVIVDVVG